ncbi:hypothetical protein FEM48_Zijuj01G0218200 [Ziziphus jujuba var. spinosa]|uniref:F-box domain-containing protein n=1 Tax=Ziziphus jujuba var. spinosa TaxID=714518 RepID=A0A978W3R5_ZIZJJ|nr:hypothetical protein FEM48_Zijuj01G0218200 [Ziziphus jujuba var. spinosa]
MEKFGARNNIGKQRKRKKTSEGIDYISHLPEEIILHILSFLPIKELTVVSLLSNLWKYMVVSHLSKVPSSLNLDEPDMIRNFITRSIYQQECAVYHRSSRPPRSLHHVVRLARKHYMDFVNRTLLLHSGCTINDLHFCFCYDGSDGYKKRINSWLRFALTNNIKEIELDFSEGELHRSNALVQPYEFPLGCFSPRMLNTLILKYCKLRALCFGVLQSLQRLCLQQVKILKCSIGEIVSKCPILEEVSLEYCTFPNDFMVNKRDMKIKRLSLIECQTVDWPMFAINISVPDLSMLTIVGRYLMTSRIRKAVHLLDVIIDINQLYADHVQGDALGSLLNGLSHSQTLILTTWCIQVLPTGENLLHQLPIPLQNLKHLKLVVGLVKQELPGISCLLRSCPNLENLTLEMQEPFNVDWAEFEEDIPDILNFEEHSYWELQNLPFSCLQNYLKQIKISGFTGRTNEMQMIRFLLENAGVLEKMEIYHSPQQEIDSTGFQDNLHHLLNLPRASPRAQMEIFTNFQFNNM